MYGNVCHYYPPCMLRLQPCLRNPGQSEFSELLHLREKSGKNFQQQRDGPKTLTNMNMIVSHRESLENQGSQARRVPEAYR